MTSSTGGVFLFVCLFFYAHRYALTDKEGLQPVNKRERGNLFASAKIH